MYDVAVIGSGPGGYVAALRAALRGAKTCCIEEKLLGGVCLNVGCIPAKAMLYASGLFWMMRHSKEFGFSAKDPCLDAAAYMARTGKVVEGLRNGVAFLLKKRRVDVIKGRARLISNDTIGVDIGGKQQTLKSKAIIVATGSRPARPNFIAWNEPRVMTTDEATTAADLPKSVLVIGGGVIGCEFATIYSELGIRTTIVEMLDSLVANLDGEACRAIAENLRAREVDIITGVRLQSVTADNAGVTATLDDGRTLEAEKLLAAVGRRPNVENLGLEELGVQLEDGIIKVDNFCRTNIEDIYAVGDVAETRQYAHLASRMGIVAADNATGHKASDDRTVVPVGVYTHPEVACVGLSESHARHKHSDVHIAKFPYSASGMAQACGDTRGLVKIMADRQLGAILGAVVAGPHATDVIQEITVAMRNELTVDELAETIHPHPTFVEAVGETAEAWLGLPLHIIG